MKQCYHCGQLLAEKISVCPTCGGEVAEGIQSIDNYRILSVLHEGYSSVFCHAVNEETEESVAIRVFTPQSGVDAQIANRLKQELEILKELPEDYFVNHLEIRQSDTGLWYRVSEWIDTINLGQLLASDRFKDHRTVFRLFYRLASILEGLHQIGHSIPHLILNDIIVFEGREEDLAVKVDYKISRFLDPRLDRPGPMLKNLLLNHPDIINDRPLDTGSDIWSLGKIFVELLSGDVSGEIDYVKTVDQLAIPDKARMLLKIMLADDPDLRPESMAQVARSLSQITDKEIVGAQKKNPEREIRGLKRWVRFAAILLVALIVLGIFSWFYFTQNKEEERASLSDYANRYAGSVAFVVVDYQLKVEQQTVYRNRTEGTAFLVNSDGYLLTNRHVACPWLDDGELFQAVARLKYFGHSPHLEYRAFLWFEGQRAFKRLPESAQSSDVEDGYHIKSAYRLDGPKTLKIAGVARPPVKSWQIINSPLKDDFAVLKIDPVPKGLIPLPLDDQITPIKIPKLTPVMTMGFPLGSRTQTDKINVSVSTGHVRRTFGNMFQVDTSIYPGNSGGPVIDPRGRVVGIASSVYTNWAQSPVPVVTLLSDIGLVLPINKAVSFLVELKTGQPKWNGFVDLALDEKLEEIHEAAGQGQWEKAQQLADDAYGENSDPAFAMAAGLMKFCRNDYEGAGDFFSRALSMNKENDLARLMLYLLDYIAGKTDENRYQQTLKSLDWRSPAEFFGYLVKVMSGEIEFETVLKKGNTDRETSWFHYIAGLIHFKRGNPVAAENQFRMAISTAVASDHWPYLMAMSRLESIFQNHSDTMADSVERTAYQTTVVNFVQSVHENWAAKLQNYNELAPMRVQLIRDSVSPAEKLTIIEKMLQTDKNNNNLLVQLAYYSGMDGAWEQALEYTRRFIKSPGWESSSRLAGGLLEPLVLNQLHRVEEAKISLEAFHNRIQDPWYRDISASLLGRMEEQELLEKAGKQPAYLVTGLVALGLWEEGRDQKKQALRHYREALGSYRDDRLEYQFATERIKKLQIKINEQMEEKK
jgi:S1-C subfamily serine protease